MAMSVSRDSDRDAEILFLILILILGVSISSGLHFNKFIHLKLIKILFNVKKIFIDKVTRAHERVMSDYYRFKIIVFGSIYFT